MARADWRLGLAGAAVALGVLPWFLPSWIMTLAIEALIFSLFAMSLDLMVGYTRLYSFGHAAAYGLGAYAVALVLVHLALPLPVAIVVAVALACLVALPVAWVCTRTHGVSFAMLTLAFAQLGYASIFQFRETLGGSNGIAGIPRPHGPFGIAWFDDRTAYYYLVLFCLLGSYAVCRTIVTSPFGAVLAGIRENEAKTRALGYNTRRYKMALVVAAYGFGALAGALYASFSGFVSPELFFWFLSGTVLIMVIVGGAGTLIGPAIGGAFFLVLEHQLSEITDVWPLIFGSVFIAFVMFAPQGIWGLVIGRARPGAENEEHALHEAADAALLDDRAGHGTS